MACRYFVAVYRGESSPEMRLTLTEYLDTFGRAVQVAESKVAHEGASHAIVYESGDRWPGGGCYAKIGIADPEGYRSLRGSGCWMCVRDGADGIPVPVDPPDWLAFRVPAAPAGEGE